MNKMSVKERIIEAASRLFYFEGYNQTGINQIIEEANVAKSSMYQTFRSKEDIAVVYLQRRHSMWMGDLAKFVSEKKEGREKMEGAIDFVHHWLIDVEFRGCGFQNIITDLPEGQDKISDQVALHKNELFNWIHEQVKAENRAGEDSEVLAGEIIVLVEGAIILSQIQKNSWPIESAKSALRKLLD